MAEYIDRADAHKVIIDNSYIDDMLKDLYELPAADVAPVVHAQWIKEYTLGWYDGEQNYKLICPACNYSYLDNHLGAIAPKHFNYCPNCGAKMDEEDDGQTT